MCVSQNYNRYDKGGAKTPRKHISSLISTTVIKFHLSEDDTTLYNQRWNTGDSYFECAAWYSNNPKFEKPLLYSNINLILRAKRLPRVLWCLFRWCLMKANSIKWWWSSCLHYHFFPICSDAAWENELLVMNSQRVMTIDPDRQWIPATNCPMSCNSSW